MLITAPIMAYSGLRKVENLDVTLTLVVAAGVLAIILLITVIFLLVFKRYALIQKQTDDLNQVTRETLSGIP